MNIDLLLPLIPRRSDIVEVACDENYGSYVIDDGDWHYRFHLTNDNDENMSTEDNFETIYEYSDWVRNVAREGIDNNEEQHVLDSFGLLKPTLTRMEAMVRDIEFCKDRVGFEIETREFGKPVAVPKSIGKRYYYPLATFYQHFAFPERHVYSPHVSAVSEAFEALGFYRHTVHFGNPSALEPYTDKLCGEVFNHVIARIGEIVDSRSFKERLRTRKRNAERNETKGLAIEQQVFNSKSRQLVLMLHFGYQQQYRSEITLDEIQKHRKKFFNNCRTNTLLRGIKDYIWKLEEGNESGLHLHALLFYSADSCRDVYIAKMIGEYWVKVTHGKGQYWNSNADKHFHAKYGHGIGTGEIEWHDEAKREALRKNIRYMTKADQYLRMKYGEHCRLFGTSQVQERKRQGRPRSIRPPLDVEAASDTRACSLHADLLDDAFAEYAHQYR